ncbi:MAG: hypothetical protein M3R15_04170, partial [Acidobacteriota bacterium]|nr:hypothetical protein [Acidobacteriota bacterium]
KELFVQRLLAIHLAPLPKQDASSIKSYYYWKNLTIGRATNYKFHYHAVLVIFQAHRKVAAQVYRTVD